MIEFVSQHWRGKLALAKATWLIGIALTILIVLLDNFSPFGVWEGDMHDRVDYSRFAGSALLILIVVPVWQIAGLWRAADNHIDHVGTILAGRATQMLATLLMLFCITRFMGLIATVSEHTPPLLAIGAYSVELVILPNGRELDLNGGLGSGVADRVNELLKQNPGIRRIRLNSVVGLPEEARRLATVILDHSLNTYVKRRCMDVCVVPFLAGRHRYMQRNSLLVFTSNGGLPESELDYLHSRGLDTSFLQQWLAAGANGWSPSEQDLRSAQVVHTMLGSP